MHPELLSPPPADGVRGSPYLIYEQCVLPPVRSVCPGCELTADQVLSTPHSSPASHSLRAWWGGHGYYSQG